MQQLNTTFPVHSARKYIISDIATVLMIKLDLVKVGTHDQNGQKEKTKSVKEFGCRKPSAVVSTSNLANRTLF